MDKELFDAIKWTVTLVRKNFNIEDLSMQERGHIKALNTALQNAESLPKSDNSKSAPLICECGDHIASDYAFVNGKYLCPVCMEW